MVTWTSALRLAGTILPGVMVAAGITVAEAQSLPGTKRDRDFDAVMKTINLDDPSLRLVYKPATGDGSSIGLFIGQGDKPTNASFVPTNSSSIPEAEVVSYRLARFLGVSRNYYPVDYYKLGPKATARFRDMILSTRETSEDRINNRNIVLKDLKANPDSILGNYRQRPKSKMYPANSLGTQGKFNEAHPLARAIRANGPMPTNALTALPGVTGGQPAFPKEPKETQLELARQLSTIFVIDQLLGQWDRFWQNLEASGDRNGRLKLFARDNGGASLDDWEGHDDYARWTTRFDRDVMQRLTALNAFLKGAASDFAGYKTPDAWKQAAGFIDPASYETFAKKLAQMIDKRLPALVKQYGDKVYFPAKSAAVAKADAADTGVED